MSDINFKSIDGGVVLARFIGQMVVLRVKDTAADKGYKFIVVTLYGVSVDVIHVHAERSDVISRDLVEAVYSTTKVIS